MSCPGEVVAPWSSEKVWLFRYMQVAAVLAFCNRNAPSSFLPLVLAQEFHQPPTMIGVVLAAYPAAAFLACGWATRVVVSARNIVLVHCNAMITMAAVTAVFGLARVGLALAGPSLSSIVVIGLRVLQGVTSAVYLAANTTLISRFFSDSLPYVLAMVEVSVGLGAQLGRMTGGFLFDFGGFLCPFAILAVLQASWGVLGYQFNSMMSAHCLTITQKTTTELQCKAFLTKRNVICLLGTFCNYLIVGQLDSCLPDHLEKHLGPLSVSTVGALMSLRALAYLASSYLFARAMHGNWITLERTIALGAACCLLAGALVGPLAPVQAVLDAASLSPRARLAAAWALQLLSLVIGPAGLAGVFIPALPLMHSEVRHLGGEAVEQVSLLFIGAMSLGEALGPVVGGALASRAGFAASAAACAAPMYYVLAGSLALRDPGLAALGGPAPGQPPDVEGAPRSPLLAAAEGGGKDRATSWAEVLVDGDFRNRAMPFALRQEVGPPGSAPANLFRRPFDPLKGRCESL